MSLFRPLIMFIRDLDVVFKALDNEFIKALYNVFIKDLDVVIKALDNDFIRALDNVIKALIMS